MLHFFIAANNFSGVPIEDFSFGSQGQTTFFTLDQLLALAFFNAFELLANGREMSGRAFERKGKRRPIAAGWPALD